MSKLLLYYSISLVLLLFGCKSSSKKNSSSTVTHSKAPKVKSITEDNRVEKVLATARSYMGTPYKFGGTTKAGIDCSGLVLQSFKSIGITLPRTSSEQSKSGNTISVQQVAPGDLVFFTDKKGNTKITHVGIISFVRNTREIKFIHASTKLGVVENDLMVTYYESLIIKYVRIL